MPRITVEIEGTSKNVKLLLYAQNPVLTWDFSDTPHNAVWQDFPRMTGDFATPHLSADLPHFQIAARTPYS